MVPISTCLNVRFGLFLKKVFNGIFNPKISRALGGTALIDSDPPCIASVIRSNLVKIGRAMWLILRQNRSE